MRVVYVSPHAVRGGAERTLMDLLALHDRAAVDPAVIFLQDGPLVAEARSLGVQTEIVRAPRMRSLLAAERVKRVLALRLSALKADLVHSVMAWGHVYGGEAAHLARVPAVWFQQDIAHWRSAINVLASLTPARTILANSAFTAAAQHRVNPRRVRIEVVHLGTRLPVEPREARRERGRRSLGIGPGDFAVGIVGRLQRWKGQDVVIRAAASLCRARPDARLFVIGGALFGVELDFPAFLQHLAAEVGIADRVVFTGFQEDTADCLSALDVAVHASVRPEPFGLVLVEAMAAGTAVVAADAGAVREIVEPGVTALLVPPGDHEGLAAALLTLHDDTARRETMASAGAGVARARFDARIMARRIEEIYARVLRR